MFRALYMYGASDCQKSALKLASFSGRRESNPQHLGLIVRLPQKGHQSAGQLKTTRLGLYYQKDYNRLSPLGLYSSPFSLTAGYLENPCMNTIPCLSCASFLSLGQPSSCVCASCSAFKTKTSETATHQRNQEKWVW